MSESITENARGRLRWFHFWPLLLGPATVGLIALASRYYGGIDPNNADLNHIRLDTHLDWVAPRLALVTAFLFWVRCMGTRNPLHMVLTVVAGTLLLRELHWSDDNWSPIIKNSAPPILIICGIWAWIWRDLLKRPLADRRHAVWVIAAAATFLLAQLIERRVFRFVPGEGPIHSKLEEAVEVAGHVSLLIAALIGKWTYYLPNGRTCSIGEGFWAGPTGRLWARLTGKGPKDSD